MARMIASPPTAGASLQSVFAAQLREAMIARGITQAKLAEMLGVTPPSVNQWLNGSNITVSTIEKIADAIGIQCSLLISERQ